jgi:hypothetical protein
MTHETLRTTEGRFSPGQSGNPAGRPKGSRNKASLVAEALLEEATGPVVAQAIETALAGDGPMLRTLVQAMFPKNAGRSIELDIPEGSWGDPVVFLEATMRAVALGEITPQEAALLARLASVMVQAQRMRLRIEQFKVRLKPKPEAVGVEPAKEAGVASNGSGPRVSGDQKPSRQTVDRPVALLYSGERAAAPCIPPVLSRDPAAASIAPVISRSDERRKAA